MRVAVLGMGYVGCVTAMCLASRGHEVVGVDVNPVKVAQLEAGETPIVEPGLAQLLRDAVASNQFSATADASCAVADADVVIISVGTPSNAFGEPNLSYVETVMEDVGTALSSRSRPVSVVVRSTVPPGTTRANLASILEKYSGRAFDPADITLAFCPEFLREGTAIADFFDPPLTVFGLLDTESGPPPALARLFDFVKVPPIFVTIEDAEALKYACNAFHAIKVTFANEISRVFTGKIENPRDVMRLFVQDKQLNISPRYLRPGFAYGGSCLPKDVAALVTMAAEQHVPVPLLESLPRSNDAHVTLAVKKILDVRPRAVAFCGISFKANTDDLRESPYVEVAERLIGKGISVRIYDEAMRPAALVGANKESALTHLPHLQRIWTPEFDEALDGADCVVLGSATAVDIDAICRHAPSSVIDLSGHLPPETERALRDLECTRYIGLAW